MSKKNEMTDDDKAMWAFVFMATLVGTANTPVGITNQAVVDDGAHIADLALAKLKERGIDRLGG